VIWNGIELPEKNIYFKDDDIVIYCADNREILPLFPDKSFDLVLTDPPYNGDLQYGAMTNDSRDWEEYISWLKSIIQSSENVTAGPVIYFLSKPGLINICSAYPPKWVGSWYSAPSNPAGNVKATLMIPIWEPFLIYGDLNVVKAVLKDAYICNPNQAHLDHPCPKPISLMKQIINSGAWGIILDPFMGSATTLFAAKQLNRKCIGIEIEEKYCKIAVDRLRQSVMKLEVL
jgi:DNA modification methylase